MLSAALGSLDLIYGYGRDLSGAFFKAIGCCSERAQKHLLFREGFGDVAQAALEYRRTLDVLREGKAAQLFHDRSPLMDVRIEPKGGRLEGRYEAELLFTSPWRLLPAEAATARALLLSRDPEHFQLGLEKALEEPKALHHPTQVLVHMPAFGEEGYGSRGL
jgi:hypothetical protein